MAEKIISMQHICKEFSGVKVLKDVDFNIYEGRIMALLGENGAGKSTLMKILTGVYTRSSGEVFVNGEPVSFSSTKESQDRGIAIIHQELNMVSHLSVAENIFLGREPVNRAGKIKWKQLYQDSKKWLDKLGIKEDPKTLVGSMSVGKQQMIEIAKALSLNAKVLIMDEPTGALTLTETERLFEVIRELKADGHSIVYISHRLQEIFEICDDITVLRDGELVGERSMEGLDEEHLIEMMVGRTLSEQYPRIPYHPGDIMLEVTGLSNQFAKDATFALHSGEILGVAGLMGAGRTELMRTIYGIYKKDQGEVFLEGKKVEIHCPKDALRLGIAYVSEDRKANGIHLGLNVCENVTMSSLNSFVGRSGRIKKKDEEEKSTVYIKDMSIKTSGTKQLLRYLSGGNQQKVSIAKSLSARPKILILDEPTRGVDVGAKKEIYELINKLKAEGMSIVMISSEIPEILGISDRIMVMHEGRITGELMCDSATQEKIMTLAVGKEVS